MKGQAKRPQIITQEADTLETINLQWLRQARRKKHLNMAQVAKHLGKNKATIWRWENGKSQISMNNLCKLAHLYGIEVSSVMEVVGE